MSASFPEVRACCGAFRVTAATAASNIEWVSALGGFKVLVLDLHNCWPRWVVLARAQMVGAGGRGAEARAALGGSSMRRCGRHSP